MRAGSGRRHVATLSLLAVALGTDLGGRIVEVRSELGGQIADVRSDVAGLTGKLDEHTRRITP